LLCACSEMYDSVCVLQYVYGCVCIVTRTSVTIDVFWIDGRVCRTL
jgi:hypothetical protein